MTPTLEAVESAIDQLSVSDQLFLLEHLARRIRARSQPAATNEEKQLADMASDPAIQRELQRITAEFSRTEADGLGEE